MGKFHSKSNHIQTSHPITDQFAHIANAAGVLTASFSIVVSGRTNMPGEGLFKYAKRKKLQKGDDLTFIAMELNRVCNFAAKRDGPGVG